VSQVPDPDTVKEFNKNIADEFRANDGKVGGPFEGNELLLLTNRVIPIFELEPLER
jgi:hypothetical protein